MSGPDICDLNCASCRRKLCTGARAIREMAAKGGKAGKGAKKARSAEQCRKAQAASVAARLRNSAKTGEKLSQN